MHTRTGTWSLAIKASFSIKASFKDLFCASRSAIRFEPISCMALYCLTMSLVMSSVSSRCCSSDNEKASLRSLHNRSDRRASKA